MICQGRLHQVYLLGFEITPEEQAMFNIYDGSQVAGKPIALSLGKPGFIVLAADAETHEEVQRDQRGDVISWRHDGQETNYHL